MKRFLKSLTRVLFSQTAFILISLLVQLAIMVAGVLWLNRYASAVFSAMSIIGGAVLIYLINKDELPEFKLAWAIPICFFPIFGTIFFFLVDRNVNTLKLKKERNRIIAVSKKYLYQNADTKKEMMLHDLETGQLGNYLYGVGGYPSYRAGNITYYRSGEDMWQPFLEDLRSAKTFIFLEYFIIAEGKVWNSVLDILKQKAAEGVEVRVMYDGMCSLVLLPYSYPRKLQKFGIKAKAVSQVVPMLSTHQNSRDHRKIMVVDGKVAYTGGINLSDEYMNEVKRFGYWKDTAIRLEGAAVDSFTMMFLRTWNMFEKDRIFDRYMMHYSETVKDPGRGFCIPYGDGPNQKENLAEKIYLDVLNTAKDYVHIMSPYFVIDSTMLMMLKYAAQRGIDVKIILPHIPDKKYAFYIARTFYPTLLEAGVKIYEFEPGFVHAKVFTSDDRKAIVGSINLDYRSLYHHYECATYIFDAPVVKDVEADFQDTLQKCIPVTEEYYKALPAFTKFLGHILNLFAPMM